MSHKSLHPHETRSKARGRICGTELADAYAANTVHAAFVANKRVYGARKLWRVMKRARHAMGRDQVARLMGVVGITGAVRSKHRTINTQRDDRAPRHPDLIERKWNATTRPDQWWEADFTYYLDIGRVRLHRILRRRLLPQNAV